MVEKEKIIGLIYSAIDEVNELLNEEERIVKSFDTVLYGKSSNLDSVGLVNLIVAVESVIEDKLEAMITIADERALSQKNSPFKTIGSLTDYVFMLVGEGENG